MPVPLAPSKIGVQTPIISVAQTSPEGGRVVHQLQRIGEAVPPQRETPPIDRFLIGSPGEVEDFATVRDSALQWDKQGNWEEALRRLQKAARMLGGSNDWKTWYWMAKIANDHQQVSIAFEAAARAVELAKKPEQTEEQIEKSKQILDYLRKTFSPVQLIPDPNQRGIDHGYILIEDEGGFIEINKKEVFKAIREKFEREGVTLPSTVYFPVGKYRINGQRLEVKPTKEAPEAIKAKEEVPVFLLERQPDSEKFTFDFWPQSLTPGRGAGGLFLELPSSGSKGEDRDQK